MELKCSLQDGRGLYHVTSTQIKDWILGYFAKDTINLGNVDNTSDIDKPISTATQVALNNKLDKTTPYVMSVNTQTGNVTLTKSSVGLSNVDNTSDVNKPVSTATQAALNAKVNSTTFNTSISDINSTLSTKLDTSEKATANGVATLDENGKIPLDQIPALSSGNVVRSVTADTLTTARTFTITGDVTSPSVSFNGSANAILNVTLPNTGVTANTYGSATTIPVITYNAKGLVTSATTATIPTSSTTVSGLVMLDDTVTSGATDKAATAHAVKTAYDVANEISTNGVRLAQKGVPNGVATLDANGKIPSTQMPTTGTVIASQLATTRTLSTTGDVTLAFNFNGSANVSSTATLSNVNSNAGSFGTAKSVPTVTVDAKGRITSVVNTDIALSYSDISNKPTTLADAGITNAYTKAEVDNLINSVVDSVIPPGTIIYSASRTLPSSQFLVLKGQAISRTTFARLFSIIGTTFGAGDGSTTFNVPMCSGRFIRIWDDGAGIDPGRGFGTIQEDAFKSHYHELMISGDDNRVVPVDNAKAVANSYRNVTQAYNGNNQVVPTGSSETRPKNIALQAYIRI
ncbi:tail fiber protein [Acinetobacter phage vB_AbaM_ME3]|uniref:Tail fiber protein n=1 Tax=Acinetobacter phage vB_AbaM_ME3 TaxID=1837876 RepID=A0A172Q097_9CAUD|nr:tail fiber protein [Acinetobacter phage vB_AbaM_ME3]AND75267.1 tail fiber protein [Acinetobacter phage vB_AbaM_ME3]